jgi:hypothetical protein
MSITNRVLHEHYPPAPPYPMEYKCDVQGCHERAWVGCNKGKGVIFYCYQHADWKAQLGQIVD